jgi:hypothetical protein
MRDIFRGEATREVEAQKLEGGNVQIRTDFIDSEADTTSHFDKRSAQYYYY